MTKFSKRIKKTIKGLVKIYDKEARKGWNEKIHEEQNYNDCMRNLTNEKDEPKLNNY